MNRTFKGSCSRYGDPRQRRVAVAVHQHAPGKPPWLTVHLGEQFLGSIDSVATLRRLHAALGEALPPKRTRP